MQFWDKFVCSQSKFVNDFIHFKLIIKIVQFLNFNESQFLLPQTAQFDKNNPFCLVFLTWSCMEYCCHVWAGAPSCYLELLNKLQK